MSFKENYTTNLGINEIPIDIKEKIIVAQK